MISLCAPIVSHTDPRAAQTVRASCGRARNLFSKGLDNGHHERAVAVVKMVALVADLVDALRALALLD